MSGSSKSGRRVSRAAQREALLAQAAKVEVEKSYDVVVIGGGAAGLVAAICAAEDDASVLVLERDLECGRSILATGNGRCNFSNVELDAEAYNDPEFVSAVFGGDALQDILGFFRDSNLRWGLEGARLYPMSRKAASVRNVLLARAEAAGVRLAPARSVTLVEAAGGEGEDADGRGGFEVTFDEVFGGEADSRTVEARCVVAASGGGALDALDGLGLESTTFSAALCPVACEADFLEELDGCRAHVRAQLSHGRFPCWSERGEVLFRSYGLSGIVTFNMSREVEEGDTVELDLAPDLGSSDLQQIVDPFGRGEFAHGCLDGVLDPKVAAVVEGMAEDSEELISLVKALPLRAMGTCEEDSAQVTQGGLVNEQFDDGTLECTEVPGLFACGEVLDVDGACGGYNLSWAWKSGMVAGAAAARRARRLARTAR